MFRSVRTVVGLCLLGGVSLAAIIGWATGFFGRATSVIAGLWSDLTSWLNEPMGWDQLLAGAGVLIAPLVLLVIIFALADN